MRDQSKSVFLEIERKYHSNKEEWDSFVSLVKSKNPHRELLTGGPDSYYDNGSHILRWRFGKDISELTIKARFSLASSLVREEVELNVKNNSPKEIIRFVKSLGYTKLFRIHKTCHIFWLKNDIGEACIVIYVVKSKTHPDKYFIEIEAEKGLNIESSKKLIRHWEKELKLPASRRLNSTLFEIYSGKITEMAGRANTESQQRRKYERTI